MFVLGTAGHIDHGKSVLVRALTGIDPDRLDEEKARGMTIDLGFAWLTLPSGREVGIVDVPGHERFIKNMLAGVGGIDLALLVIAANESVMPQTREHLAILDLLGIQRGIVAVTKRDLVDDEWLGLVRMEVEELLQPTTLSGSPIVPVSALTGEGLPDLVAAIDSMLESAPTKQDRNRARLPIDRVFTMAGSGTVVTGTLIDGSLSVGDEVEVVPRDVKSRLRGLQTHRSRIETAHPGSRVAANLVGVTTSQVGRGDVVVRPGWLKPTTMLSVRLRLLPHLRHAVRHNARLSFFSGAAEAVARVRLLEGNEMKAGETGWAQLSLDRPIAVIGGDHFIIRSTTDTLGGGRIVDAHARRLRRHRESVLEGLRVREEGSAEDVVYAALEAGQPLSATGLAARTELAAAAVIEAVGALLQQDRVVGLGSGEARLLFTRPGWERLAARAREMVGDYHARFPARAGMPRVELGNKLGSRTQYPAMVTGLVEHGVVVEEGRGVRLPEHKVALSAAQKSVMEAFLRSVREHPYSPPADLIPDGDVLAMLIDQGRVIKVADGVVFSAEACSEMTERIRAYLAEHQKVTLAEVRDMFGTSRRYAQALLEYLDRQKVTRRVGDERVLY